MSAALYTDDRPLPDRLARSGAFSEITRQITQKWGVRILRQITGVATGFSRFAMNADAPAILARLPATPPAPPGQ